MCIIFLCLFVDFSIKDHNLKYNNFSFKNNTIEISKWSKIVINTMRTNNNFMSEQNCDYFPFLIYILFPKFSSILAFNLNKIIKRAQELDQENCIFDLWLRLAAYCISPDIVGGCTENDVKLQEINKLIIDLILASCTCCP